MKPSFDRPDLPDRSPGRRLVAGFRHRDRPDLPDRTFRGSETGQICPTGRPVGDLWPVQPHLSAVIRDVRDGGHSIVITVDGVPAARVSPIPRAAHTLAADEAASHRALSRAIRRDLADVEPFDAVGLIRDGR